MNASEFRHMMNSPRWKIVDVFAYALLLVGALNWGLFGLFRIDLVAGLFGYMTMPSRIIYSLVGLAALYDILAVKSIWKRWEVHFHAPVHA